MSSKAPQLGQERKFSELLNGAIDADMLTRFRKFEAKSMLDIGCRDGASLLHCHYTLGVPHLEGVECEGKSAVDEEMGSKYTSPDTGQPLSSIEEYWSWIRPNDADFISTPRSLPELQELMLLRFDTRAEHYTPRLSQYDLIVLSHVLHYQTETAAQRTLATVIRCAHPGTLIYLSVKEGFAYMKMTKDQLLALCRQFSNDLGLVEYEGPVFQDEGPSYIFTNL